MELQDEGSFFVGGEVVTTQFTGAETGSYVRKQMYVHYRVPENKKHKWPIVLVHGGGLTGATYETTPDGREGWDTYFVRKGFTVYVVDEPGRGRAGFDPEPINRGKAEANLTLVPTIRRFTQELAWTFFRIGPTYPTPYPNTKFPIAAARELSAQGVPYAETTFQGGGNATAPPALAALLDRIGPAIVISHSLGGPHTDLLVGLRPNLLKGVINLEAVQTPVAATRSSPPIPASRCWSCSETTCSATLSGPASRAMTRARRWSIASTPPAATRRWCCWPTRASSATPTC